VSDTTARTDVVLVGAGIMGATLAALLRRLEPGWSITVIERLDTAGAESSSPWNNAGTGHAGLCEMNYTPERPGSQGSIDITKAVRINEQFQVTRQFWAYAVEQGILTDRRFLNRVPHVSFVHGAQRVDYLRRRQQALADNPLFAGTELVDDPDEFARRLPFMAAERDFSEPIALNWAAEGTDVDFGALAGQLIGYCVRNGATALFGHEVRDLTRQSGGWTLRIVNRRTGEKRNLNAKFVFVGAGGDALTLLQKSGIAEIKGFAGFPIGGRFLRTDNPVLTAAHRAKVYGIPAPGAPPLGALHLDLRFVDGKSWLVFGPYAGWSPKFLKHGHVTDLPRSIRPDNVVSMLGVGLAERTLVKYLVGQLRLTERDRIEVLREFAPSAQGSDWQLTVAGQRVQVIRPAGGKGGAKGGMLEFGTTVVGSADGSIAGLLGGSPGASTAVPIMLDVLASCFADRYQSWLPRLKEMVPSLGTRLSDEPALYDEVRRWSANVLQLNGS
jgi:malate dehydrogenase (quinone)